MSYQLNRLIQLLLEGGVISREVLLIYLNCCIIFRNYENYEYNYQELLAYHFEQIYSAFEFDIKLL